MITDVRRAAKSAYRGTVVYEVRALITEESRWQRKVTIARNKLSDVRSRINNLAEKLALEKTGVSVEPNNH